MTVFGYHTQSELADLVNAYETQYNDQKASIVKYGDDHDPPTADWADFMTRWTAWSAKYRSAVEDAKKSLGGGGIASEIINSNAALSFTEADSQYKALANAFAPATDFDRELIQKFGVHTGYGNTPQPTAPDTDLSVLQAAQKATSHIVDPVVGDTSLAPDKRTPLGVPTSTWKKLGLAAAAGAAGILVLRKVIF